MVKEVYFFTEMGYTAYSQAEARRYGYNNLMFPNEQFSPERAQQLYAMYFDELQYASETGFDGVMINEHHNNPLSMMPSVNVIGASVAQRNRKGRIVFLGNVLPIHDNPLRVAEEVVPLLAHLHVVPPRGELPRQRGRIAPFHAERARGHPPGPPVEPARRLHAGLRAKPAKEAAGEQRGYRLGLTLAAHGPQRGARPSARKIQSGGERVQRALAGRERIDVARIEAEEGATVLQHDARVTGDHSRAVGVVERLDQ